MAAPVTAQTIFSTLLSGSGQDFATALTSDAQGNTYVVGLTYSADFPVTAGAYQTTFGQTCDAFLTKVGPDGNIIWSTFLGGVLDDFATGVAVDSSGNVWITGYTRSPNFPLVNPIQSAYTGFETFVAKVDPTGAHLIYSTLLSGTGETGGAGIAVDSTGNVYVVSNTLNATGYPGIRNLPALPGILVSKLTSQGALVYSYFHPYGAAGGMALDSSGAVYVAGAYGSNDTSSATKTFGVAGPHPAMVFKLSPDGSKELYESALGGSVQDSAAAIAVASTGEVWVGGSTASADFPLAHPLQNSLGARPLWKSTNGGTTWAPLDNLPFAIPLMLAVDPTTPNTVYAATEDAGLVKSLDGGATWTPANSGIATRNVSFLAINPANPQVLFAVAQQAGKSVVYKSSNGASTWSLADSFSPITSASVDPLNPNIVYEIGENTGYAPGYVRKSTDGGATWTTLPFPAALQSMVVDPHVSGNLIATSNLEVSGPNGVGVNVAPYFYRSVDGGADWVQNQTTKPTGVPGLVIDGSTNPSTVYDGVAFRSTDGGVTWQALPASPASSNTLALAVDPSGTLYAAGGSGIYVSHDHGQTWTAIGAPVYPAITGIVPAGSGGTLYATIRNQTGAAGLSLGISPNFGSLLETWTSGFLSKLSADGSTLEYSTYLRGHPAVQTGPSYISEPANIQTHNWIAGIALDSAGNVVAAGGTRASDFPTANPLQAANAGLADAFAASLSADGSSLNYSTYYGGSQDDGALAVGLDAQANILFAGQTFSPDFPIAGVASLPFTYGDGFLVKLAAPAPPVITAVLNGASYQPGIEAGSWVVIKGTNLANRTTTWASSDFVGNNLPTSLNGVSVTIDGKPAFVEYVSPSQINVLAPADSATGTVNVVVDNNGAFSPPAATHMLALAPAFFLYGATNYAVASRLPGYVAVGNPTAAAHAGDLLVLWGSGFGATNPASDPSVVVSGAPIVTPAPTVTVGGMPVQVISATLVGGEAGLYQVTIQLPANVRTGSVAVVASLGTAMTPSGVTLFVQ